MQESWDGRPCFSRVVSSVERPVVTLAAGEQLGAQHPPGLSHQSSPSPSRAVCLPGKDLAPSSGRALVILIFAAETTNEMGLNIRKQRQRAMLVAELGQRLGPVTEYLRGVQAPEVQKVTGGRHLALLAALMILVDWPDPTFMEDMLYGFPAVGFSWHNPTFNAQEAEYISPHMVFQDGMADAMAICQSLRPSEIITQAG